MQTQCRDHLLDEDNVTVSTVKTTESDRQAARKYIQSLSNSSRIDARYGPLTKLAASDEDDYYDKDYDESLLSGGSSRKKIGKQVSLKCWIELLLGNEKLKFVLSLPGGS